MATILHKTLNFSLTAALASWLQCPASRQLRQPKNYWLVSSTGQVFAYGKAKTHGSESGKRYFRTGQRGSRAPRRRRLLDRHHQEALRLRDASHYKYRAWWLEEVHRQGFNPKRRAGRIRRLRRSGPSRPMAGEGAPYHHDPEAAARRLRQSRSRPASLSAPTATESVQSQTLSAGGVSGGTWSWALGSGSLSDRPEPVQGRRHHREPRQRAPRAHRAASLCRRRNSQCSGKPCDPAASFLLSVGVPAMEHHHRRA